MPPGDGWYLAGPLIAVAVVCLVGAVLWRMGLRWALSQEQDPLRELYADGLSIFADTDDYGLLCAAAVADDPGVAHEIRGLLADAGIRATSALRRDGRFVILVFGEHADEARRLVGDSPAL
jgi:hypothetical protein